MSPQPGLVGRLDPALAPFLTPTDRAAAVADPAAERERRRAERSASPNAGTTGLSGVSVEDVEIERGDPDVSAGLVALLPALGGEAPAAVVRVRLFRPTGGESRAPVLYLHGGAFVFGDIADSGRECAEICRATGRTVAMLDYRLAPEHPYPAALADGVLALLWLSGLPGGGRGRAAVVGSSAGGNLAAALALLVRDKGLDLIGLQVLISPVLDPRMASGSMEEFGTTPGWNGAACAVMWRQYLQGRPHEELPYAAPGLAEHLRGLPPALVVAAECDPLRDEGIAYAQRLMAAGVSVGLYNAPGAFHGFLSAAPDASVSGRVMSLITDALRRSP